ncbi:hypothetical protein D3C85_274600 [compost metagenome]
MNSIFPTPDTAYSSFEQVGQKTRQFLDLGIFLKIVPGSNPMNVFMISFEGFDSESSQHSRQRHDLFMFDISLGLPNPCLGQFT